MKQEQIHNILQSALLADAHAMPLHWNYDETNRNELLHSRKIILNTMNSGEYNTYFKGKESGDQSHNGDQIIHLYTHLQNTTKFNIQEYSILWQKHIQEYRWHIDKSSKETLEHIAFEIQPSGSDSSDFSGASMGLPLILTALEDEQKAIEVTNSRITMTHNNTLTRDCSKWLIQSLFKISQGRQSIIRSMDMSIAQSNNQILVDLYEKGQKLCLRKESITELIKEVGYGCGIEVGLPILLVLVDRHQSNIQDFIFENTKAGADSSSRALIGGALIGAMENTTLPTTLISQLQYQIKN